MNTNKLYEHSVSRIVLMIILALCITISPICSALPGSAQPVYAEDAVIPITASITINSEGLYKLDPELSDATITINTTEPVTLIGNGVGEGKRAESNQDISIQCPIAGTNLIIEDLFITKLAITSDIINFTRGKNTLTIAGTNLLEYDTGYGPYCVIHIAPAAELSIIGDGTLYYYKNQQGAAIGANNAQGNGKVIFDGPTFFGKSTKQGANIGTGADAKGVVVGDIIFNSGEFTIITNSRGALIGGGAGSEGAASGGNVYINGGTFNLNVDYSGAAIGGGGYKDGNDSGGGNVFFSGGSVRTFIDYNAVDPNQNQVSLWKDENGNDITQYGVNDAAITARKLNIDGDSVALLKFNTNGLEVSSDYFEALIDEEEYYSGGKHGYKFIQEDYHKLSQFTISNTFQNWVPLETEDNLYFYATKSEHELVVNGEVFNVEWNSEANDFIVRSEDGEIIEPDEHEYPVIPDDPEDPVAEPGSGDFDGDGFTSINDVISVINIITRGNDCSEAQFAAVDMDGDGILSIGDVILMVGKIIGM